MTNIKMSIVFILLLLTFAACKVSKDVVTPVPELPPTFRNAARDVTPGIADLQWKKFIRESSLQKLIEKAIVKNYDMQLALRNIESAQLLLKQSKWAYLPDARLQVLSNFNRPSDNSLNGLSAKSFLGTTHVEDYSANITLSWEADIWGKIKNQKAGALAAYLQSEEARKWIQTNIIANVSEGFYNLLMLDAQLAIAQRNISLNDSTLRIIRLQFNAGQVTALAVQQAGAQQLTAQALVPQLEKEIAIQENALSILGGELPAAIRRTVTLKDLDIEDSSIRWPSFCAGKQEAGCTKPGTCPGEGQRASGYFKGQYVSNPEHISVGRA
jgi:multidrug efflux system outer membrane protein